MSPRAVSWRACGAYSSTTCTASSRGAAVDEGDELLEPSRARCRGVISNPAIDGSRVEVRRAVRLIGALARRGRRQRPSWVVQGVRARPRHETLYAGRATACGFRPKARQIQSRAPHWSRCRQLPTCASVIVRSAPGRGSHRARHVRKAPAPVRPAPRRSCAAATMRQAAPAPRCRPARPPLQRLTAPRSLSGRPRSRWGKVPAVQPSPSPSGH